jgi:hypothetical protein
VCFEGTVKALRIDDDAAEVLYSGNRRVPTYTKSQITPHKNNYDGATPDPGYISGWNLTLDMVLLLVPFKLAKSRGSTPAERELWREGVYEEMQGSLRFERMCQLARVRRAGSTAFFRVGLPWR